MWYFVFTVTKEMKLVSSASSDRAWVWTVLADYADEEPKKEQLAIRFKTAESKCSVPQVLGFFFTKNKASSFSRILSLSFAPFLHLQLLSGLRQSLSAPSSNCLARVTILLMTSAN